jgi:hypothetical protein
MPIRIALVVCLFVVGSYAAGTANAADPYGGFGPSPSEPATPDASSDPGPAGAAPEAYQPLPWLEQQSQNQPDNSSAPWDQQGAAGGESDMDDEGGH